MAEPLTAEDRAKLTEVLGVIKRVEGELTRAKLAGLDVTQMETNLANYKSRLLAIKQAYFPSGR